MGAFLRKGGRRPGCDNQAIPRPKENHGAGRGCISGARIRPVATLLAAIRIGSRRRVVEEFFNSIDGEQPFGGRGSLAVTGPIAVGRGTRLSGPSGPWNARHVPSAFARTETE